LGDGAVAVVAVAVVAVVVVVVVVDLAVKLHDVRCRPRGNMKLPSAFLHSSIAPPVR
jgi:hypothetical protein